MKKVIFTFMLCVIINTAQVQAQLDSLMDVYVDRFDSAGYIFFKPELLVPGQPLQIYQNYRQDTLYTLDSSYFWTDTVLDMTHYEYKLKFRGIEVEGADYTEHAKDGNLVYANGKMGEIFLDANFNPTLSEGAALNLLLESMEDYTFYWEDEEYEQDLKEHLEDENATYYPTGKLVWALDNYKDITYHIPPQRYTLAWKFELRSIDPYEHKAYYINAHTGSVFKVQELRPHLGTADIIYYGQQNIDTKWHGGTINKYRLETTLGGRKIITKNFDPNKVNFKGIADVEDADNNWGTTNRDATSAHFSASVTWDFFKNTFGRNGAYKNEELWVLANSTIDIDNAAYYYDEKKETERIWIGPSMGMLDILGHEFTHGVTKREANFPYQDEPGALDESFSDIFGFMVERYSFQEGYTNSWDWLIGEQRGSFDARSLAHPNDYGEHNPNPSDCEIVATGQPNTYKGNLWQTHACDKGGVHVNSGVQNHWFHLLAEGGFGTNDNNDAYNIPGIGIDKAAVIAYYNLLINMQSGSQHADARAGSVLVAKLIYGDCSSEHIQTANSWAAVGVGGQSDCPVNITEQNLAPEIEIYPNPAKEAIFIIGAIKVNSIKIYTMDGRLINSLNIPTNNGTYQINIAGLSQGVYILQAKTSHGISTMKFLKI